MYWKKFIISFVFFIYLFASEAYAKDYEVYNGDIPGSVVECLNNVRIPVDKDYVLFRASEEEFKLIVGDISVDGTAYISDAACHVYTLHSDNTYYHTTEDNVYIQVNDKLVYSNIGQVPEMYERSDLFEATTLFVLIVGSVLMLILRIFKCIRSK